MITGGAGAVGMFASCLMTMSPGFGAGGGFKYLIVCFLVRLTHFDGFLNKTAGHGSSLILYSDNGRSPFHLSASLLFKKIPVFPLALTKAVSVVLIGSDEFRIACSIWLLNSVVGEAAGAGGRVKNSVEGKNDANGVECKKGVPKPKLDARVGYG